MKQYGAYLRRSFVALGSIPRLHNAGSQFTFESDDEYKLVQFIRLQSVYDGKPCWHDYKDDDFEYRPTRDDIPTYAFPLGAGEAEVDEVYDALLDVTTRSTMAQIHRPSSRTRPSRSRGQCHGLSTPIFIVFGRRYYAYPSTRFGQH